MLNTPDFTCGGAARLRRAFAVCVLTLAVFQLSENTADPDLWGHVVFGQHWLKTGELMRAEPYSWTAPGAPWINHEILAEAALGAAHLALGGPGIFFLMLGAGLATFSFALATAMKPMPPCARPVAWAFGALAVVEISYGFAARPQIFTALALAAQLWLLKEIHAGHWRWALALPPLFALWINTHGGALAGIALLAVVASCGVSQEWLSKFFPARLRGILEPPPVAGWRLAALTLICGSAMLLNPYGIELIRWLIGSVLWLRPEIEEWNPASLDFNHAVFFLCVAVSFAAFALSRRRRALWEMAALAALGVMAFRSVRHTPLFCIAALALTPLHLADALARFQGRFQGLIELFQRARVRSAAPVALWVLAAGILLATLTLHKERAWTMEVPRNQYPAAALDFIQRHGLRGNLLVFFDWGEQCIWELPDSRVSVDGRLDTCYPRAVIAAHWKFYNAEPWDQAALDIARADFALLPANLAGTLSLARQHQWQIAYFDELAAVLVRDVKKFPKLAGLKLPVQGVRKSTQGRAAFPDKPRQDH